MKLQSYNNEDFDRGASRLKEMVWIFCKALFFLLPLPLPSALRCELLRLFGATVGERVVIRSGVNVSFPWRLHLSDDIWLGENSTFLSLAKITIESDVCISQEAYLCTGSHDFRSESFDLQVTPITVRSGSWLAARSFIAPGIEVGEGSMVSAGSIVLANVPSSTIVRGNPAEVIKRL